MGRLDSVLSRARSLCYQEPSPQSWSALLRLGHNLRGPQERQLFHDYLAPQLATWPEALRSFQNSLWDRLRKEDHALWPLAGSLHVSRLSSGHAARLLALSQAHPRLPQLSLVLPSDTAPLLEALAQSPWRSHLRHLSLTHGQLRDEDLTELFSAPWPSLESLALPHNQIQGEALPELLYQRLPALLHLDLSGNPVRPSSLLPSPGASAASPLQSVDLQSAPLTLDDLEALDACPLLPHLESVNARLRREIQESPQRQRLMGRYCAPPLQKLDLRALHHSPHAIQEMLTREKLRQLPALVLDPQRTPLEPLRRSALPALRHLILYPGTAPTRDLPEALLTAPWSSQLRQLDVHHLKPTAAQWRTLLAQAALPHLEHLTLKNTDMGPAQMELLAQSQTLPALRHLELYDNPLGLAGLEALLRAPWLPRLTHLGLEPWLCGAGSHALASQRRLPLPRYWSRTVTQLQQHSYHSLATLSTSPEVFEEWLLWHRGVARHLSLVLHRCPTGYMERFTQTDWAGLQGLTLQVHQEPMGLEALRLLLDWLPSQPIYQLSLGTVASHPDLARTLLDWDNPSGISLLLTVESMTQEEAQALRHYPWLRHLRLRRREP